MPTTAESAGDNASTSAPGESARTSPRLNATPWDEHLLDAPVTGQPGPDRRASTRPGAVQRDAGIPHAYYECGKPSTADTYAMSARSRPHRSRAMAWTLSAETAAHFRLRCERLGESAFVYTTSVQPGAVLARFGSRAESEVVVDPEALGDIERCS
jgi:hypothetical protein